MKTAVSIPDDVFREAEHYANKTGKSRSQLFSDALRQYLLQHTPGRVTEEMDRVCEQTDQTEDVFGRAAARQLLKRESW